MIKLKMKKKLPENNPAQFEEIKKYVVFNKNLKKISSEFEKKSLLLVYVTVKCLRFIEPLLKHKLLLIV